MAEKLKKSYFEVLGLCCASEVALVERILKQLNGVQEISVILPTKTVAVHHTHVISDVTIGKSMKIFPRVKVISMNVFVGSINLDR